MGWNWICIKFPVLISGTPQFSLDTPRGRVDYEMIKSYIFCSNEYSYIEARNIAISTPNFDHKRAIYRFFDMRIYTQRSITWFKTVLLLVCNSVYVIRVTCEFSMVNSPFPQTGRRHLYDNTRRKGIPHFPSLWKCNACFRPYAFWVAPSFMVAF